MPSKPTRDYTTATARDYKPKPKPKVLTPAREAKISETVLAYLRRPEATPAPVNVIAPAIGYPWRDVSTVVGRLMRQGVLVATKPPSGDTGAFYAPVA